MKKKSLVATFALVAAGIVTMGAGNAQAQTIPINGGGQQVYSQAATTSSAVSQNAIDDLSYNVGVQTAYYRAGVGFTQGTTTTGENVGLEFQLQGNNATVIKAYNLNDPASRSMFQQEVNNASVTDQNLAYSQRASSYAYYQPSTYVICAPLRPIMPFGFAIGGWYAGYTPLWLMPSFQPWGGYWQGNQRVVNHTTVINNTIIERGNGGRQGPWVGGVGNRNVTGSRTVVGTQTVNRPFNNVAPANVNIRPNVATLPQTRVMPQERIVPQQAHINAAPQSNVRMAASGAGQQRMTAAPPAGRAASVPMRAPRR